MKKLLVCMLLAVLSVGLMSCGGTPTREDIAKSEATAAKMREKAADEKRRKAQKQKTAYIDDMPNWALKPPRADETGFYAVGIANGEQVNITLKKAMLEAEFGLAKVYGQALSGSERRYDEDVGDRQVTRYTALIDKIIDNVPVNGYETVEQEVLAINGKYAVFVLLKLPYDEFNRVLDSERAANTDTRIESAFDDLEKRLNRRRQQRLTQH